MILSGKTVVVTGAAGTMGLAVVRSMLEDGAQVALIDVDPMRLDSLIRFLRGNTLAVACDVSESGAVRALPADDRVIAAGGAGGDVGWG